MKKLLIVLIGGLLITTGCTSNTDKKENISKADSNITNNTDKKENTSKIDSNITSNVEEKKYTNDDIVKLAREYYEKNNDSKPKYVELDHEDGDNLVIHIYDIVDDHTATYDWYTINKNTLKGTNILEEEIDLNK